LSENDVVRRQREPQSALEMSKYLQQRSNLDSILENSLETEFKTAVASTSLARYFCEHFEALPVSAQTRILDTHDFLVMMVPLINEPPWTRRRVISDKNDDQKIIWEKYIDNNWEKVESENLLRLTKCEAQCWLAIFHLTCSKICRSQYGLNSFRKEQLLQLRKYLNNLMLDQLPVLSEVRRYMDELALMSVPENSTGHGSALLMQQVSLIRDSIIRGEDWDDVAKIQYETIFSKITDSKDEILKNIADIYSLDEVEDILGNSPNYDLTSQKVGGSILKVLYKGNQEKNGGVANIYILKLVGDSTITDSSNGTFKRTKMEISHIQKEEEENEGIPHDSRMEIDIEFVGELPHKICLKCEALDLPRIESYENFESLPKMQWRQLGSIQEKIVVQIGLRRLSKPIANDNCDVTTSSYELHTAFLSQPCVEP